MGDFSKTQNELGAIIKVPKLTDKLLGKPPFRFLHDIVTSFHKTTGFPEGLYTSDELDSSKVSDKEAKIAFLTKLIDCIQAATGEKCPARPQVIVTGAEPENTNVMLQQLAQCAKLSKDQTKAAVATALGGGAAPEPVAKAAPPPEQPKPASEQPKPRKQPEPEPKVEEPKVEEAKPKPKAEPPKEEPPKAKPKAEKPPKSPVEPDQRSSPPPPETKTKQERKPKVEERAGEMPVVSPLTGEAQRPGTASARKPPPAYKSNEVVEERSDGKSAVVANVIVESKKSAAAPVEDSKDWMKIVEQEATAARAAAAPADDAKGYLGRQALEAKREQEEQARKAAEAAASSGAKAEGIVLQTKRHKKESGSLMGENDLSKLREQLQLLTKASHPLGRFLEAIHEDIDTMSRELEMWRTEAKAQAAAAQEAQRQTEESLHEIFSKIHNIEDATNDQRMKINILRSTILSNDKTIETLLRMVVNPDVGGGKRK